MTLLPLVSVLIPCYNHSEYVVECLNSVVKNDYGNTEIVIIDDGSNDNSANKIEEWINNNKSAVKTKFLTRANKGLAKTLNELLTLSTGDFICLLGFYW